MKQNKSNLDLSNSKEKEKEREKIKNKGKEESIYKDLEDNNERRLLENKKRLFEPI